MDEKEWKEKLTPEQYSVLREKGTEAPFTGEYVHHKEDGTYTCVGCGAVLFMSNDKFDSQSGWPSFDKLAKEDAVELVQDRSHGLERTEAICVKCGGHLGHVFDDGPTETGRRYCINSCALDFQKKEE